MSEYRISVVIPSYNRETELVRALQSVSAQTYPVHEIIVIDDGSTDDTATLIKSHFPAVTYQRIEQSGVSVARNKGIENCTGNWIALLDSDDEWLPDKLSKQIQALQCNPEYILCHTDEIWIRNGNRVNPMNKYRKQGGFIYQHCLPVCAISPSSVLIKKTVFEEVGLFDPLLPVCEDYDFWLRVCSRYPALFVDELLLKKYGGHRDQLSTKHWGMDRFRIAALSKILESNILTNTDAIATRKILLEKCDILIAGAEKRGNIDLKNQQVEIKNRYSNN